MDSITLPSRFVYGETFPYEEGTHMELKLSASFEGSWTTSMTKYLETLHAFLNVGGGYLILGIQDNGYVEGCKDMNQKSIDKYNLSLDNYYRQLMYRDGTPLTPNDSLFSMKVYPLHGPIKNRYIIVFTAEVFRSHMDIQHKDGNVFYRLNASNYRVPTEKVFRHAEMMGLIKANNMHYESFIQTQQAHIKSLQNKHREKIQDIRYEERKRAAAEAIEAVRQASEILKRKYDMEYGKKSWFSWLCCCTETPRYLTERMELMEDKEEHKPLTEDPEVAEGL